VGVGVGLAAEGMCVTVGLYVAWTSATWEFAQERMSANRGLNATGSTEHHSRGSGGWDGVCSGGSFGSFDGGSLSSVRDWHSLDMSIVWVVWIQSTQFDKTVVGEWVSEFQRGHRETGAEGGDYIERSATGDFVVINVPAQSGRTDAGLQEPSDDDVPGL
jgi:hypothetical protein